MVGRGMSPRILCRASSRVNSNYGYFLKCFDRTSAPRTSAPRTSEKPEAVVACIMPQKPYRDEQQHTADRSKQQPANDCEEDLLVAHEVFNHANITTSE